MRETGSGRKLSHNGCTAGNFDLHDHGFLLLTCSTGPMEWSTGNSSIYLCFHALPVPMAGRITKYRNKYMRMGICLIYMSSFYFWSPPLARKMRCQAMRETGSGRKLSHNGCTAGNFDLHDHGFLLLTIVRLSIRPLIGVNNVKPTSGSRLK
jgi:hypothetical protein